MKKIKSIITGILSGAVFFMAIQVGVAQDNKMEVKSSVEAKALGETLEKLNAEWASTKVQNASEKTEAMKESAMKPVKRFAMKWFPLTSGDPTDENDALNKDYYGPGQEGEPCDGEGTYCGVYAEEDFNGKPILNSGTPAHTAISNFFDGNPSALVSERN